MAAEELLGASEIFDLEKPISAAEGRRSDGASDAVVDGVAEHGRGAQRDARERRLQRSAPVDGRERPYGEEQRVTGEERCHDEPCLREDHREEDRIDPQLVAHEQLDQVPVEMQDEIDQPRQHGATGYREARVRGKSGLLFRARTRAWPREEWRPVRSRGPSSGHRARRARPRRDRRAQASLWRSGAPRAQAPGPPRRGPE